MKARARNLLTWGWVRDTYEEEKPDEREETADVVKQGLDGAIAE